MLRQQVKQTDTKANGSVGTFEVAPITNSYGETLGDHQKAGDEQMMMTLSWLETFNDDLARRSTRSASHQCPMYSKT